MAQKRLREGYTTGCCAAAAVRACLEWQINGRRPECVSIELPGGQIRTLPVFFDADGSCHVVKDAGDDPDVTNGCSVKAWVRLDDGPGPVRFAAGEGVGTVTSPGLPLPPGEAAVNPVPRQMIARQIRELAGDTGAEVILSIPGGTELAKKTFNPRLGIVGGLSILGTTGIVRPMSEEAVIETLRLDLSVAVASGHKELFFVPGESGEKAVRRQFGNDWPCVQIGNHIGIMLDAARDMDVKRVVTAGFAGKLVKVAADIMNTHSHVADGRRETVCAFAAMDGASPEVIREIYECKTMTQAAAILEREGRSGLWNAMAERAASNCRLRTGGDMDVDMIFLDKEGDVLGSSAGAADLIRKVGKGVDRE